MLQFCDFPIEFFFFFQNLFLFLLKSFTFFGFLLHLFTKSQLFLFSLLFFYIIIVLYFNRINEQIFHFTNELGKCTCDSLISFARNLKIFCCYFLYTFNCSIKLIVFERVKNILCFRLNGNCQELVNGSVCLGGIPCRILRH